MALSEACRRKEGGAERQPALTMASSPSAGGATAHEGAKSVPGWWRRAAGKALSAVLFLSMWVVPPLIHRAGFRARIGSAYHVHKDMLALYSGRLTLANGAFLLLYTAWLQWTARIVAPRHFLRLHTASLWIAPVVAGIFFSPVLFQGFLAYIAYKGVEEYRIILHGLYHAAYFPPPVTAGVQPAAPGERAVLPAPATTSVPLSLGDRRGMAGGAEAIGARSKDAAGNSDMAPPPWIAGLHCTCAFLLAACGASGRSRVVGAAAACCITLIALVHSNFGPPGRDAARLLALDTLGLAYVAFALALCNMLTHQPNGGGWILLALSCSWIGDGGAYFIGGRYGRHKCAPAISPGKSWEGIGAELACNIVVVLFLSWLRETVQLEWIMLPPLPLARCVFLSVLLTVGGVLGDLCESLLKRLAGLKDSGNFFPGHGGILDRFDGIFFAGILLYFQLSQFPA